MKRVALFRGDNLQYLVFYYFNAFEIWPEKMDGLSIGVNFQKGDYCTYFIFLFQNLSYNKDINIVHTSYLSWMLVLLIKIGSHVHSNLLCMCKLLKTLFDQSGCVSYMRIMKVSYFYNKLQSVIDNAVKSGVQYTSMCSLHNQLRQLAQIFTPNVKVSDSISQPRVISVVIICFNCLGFSPYSYNTKKYIIPLVELVKIFTLSFYYFIKLISFYNLLFLDLLDLKEDFLSRIWLTYRKGFPSIGKRLILGNLSSLINIVFSKKISANDH